MHMHVKMIDRMPEQQPCRKQLSAVADACDETGRISLSSRLSLSFSLSLYISVIQALVPVPMGILLIPTEFH